MSDKAPAPQLPPSRPISRMLKGALLCYNHGRIGASHRGSCERERLSANRSAGEYIRCEEVEERWWPRTSHGSTQGSKFQKQPWLSPAGWKRISAGHGDHQFLPLLRQWAMRTFRSLFIQLLAIWQDENLMDQQMNAMQGAKRS